MNIFENTMRACMKAKSTKLKEGNPVSHELPPSIDSFLQDVAQEIGSISYNDIANFAESEFTDNDLKSLRKLRRAFLNVDPWEDEDALGEIGKKVAAIVKGAKSKEESSLREYVEEGNKVLQVTFDVEVPKNVDLNVQAMSGNTEFYDKLSDFLSSLGFEMAGDIIDATDITRAYED